jgi:hypothetical protein
VFSLSNYSFRLSRSYATHALERDYLRETEAAMALAYAECHKYRVEDRGMKSARAKKTEAAKKKVEATPVKEQEVESDWWKPE